MTENDILYALLYRLRADGAVEQPVRDCYEKLVKDFPEHGFEQVFPLDGMSDEHEAAIRELRKLGLVETAIKYHGSEGHFYHVDLRGPEFLKQQTAEPPKNEPKRDIFSTGAVRDTDEGKTHPEFISPFATERLAKVLAEGAKKYGPFNYQKGIPASRIMASLCRHLMQYQQCCADEDHLGHLAANVVFLLHVDECCKRNILPDSLMDLPDYSAIPAVHFNKDEPYEHE